MIESSRHIEEPKGYGLGSLPRAGAPILLFVVTMIVLTMVGGIVAIRFGFTVGPEVVRAGDATISGCRKQIVGTYYCNATIVWEDGSRSETKGILSPTLLTGTVKVEEHSKRSRNSISTEIIPAGAPARQTPINTALLWLSVVIASMALTAVEVMIIRVVRARKRVAATHNP